MLVSRSESASTSSVLLIFKEQRVWDTAHSNKETVVVKSNPCNYTVIRIIHKSLIESQICYTIQRRFRVCGRRTQASPWRCRGWISTIVFLSTTIQESKTTIIWAYIISLEKLVLSLITTTTITISSIGISITRH